jgi:hypothetical protein
MDEMFMKTFYNMIESELEEIRKNIHIFDDELRL